MHLVFSNIFILNCIIIIFNLKMLVAAYDFKLNHQVPQGLVTISKCNIFALEIKIVDGIHPAMACATTGGKVLIHTPYAS